MKKLFIIAFMGCVFSLVSFELSAMNREAQGLSSTQELLDQGSGVTKKKFDFSFLSTANQYIFNGWAPTLTFVTGATAYCIKYDRHAPAKAFSWVMKNFSETPKLIKYPALLLGTCMAYEYYKPRVNYLFQQIFKQRNNRS